MERASQIPHVRQKGKLRGQSDYFKQRHYLASNYFGIENSSTYRGYRKDSILAGKHFPKRIPRHPWERSECPLVKMWETFPYVLFGWREGAAVFTIKIHLLRVLVSLRRAGTMWRAQTCRVGKTHQERKAEAMVKAR